MFSFSSPLQLAATAATCAITSISGFAAAGAGGLSSFLKGAPPSQCAHT